MIGMIKNMSFYKKNFNMVGVFLTLQDRDTVAVFEGDLDELKLKMSNWSGKPSIEIEPMIPGVNPLRNLNFV